MLNFFCILLASVVCLSFSFAVQAAPKCLMGFTPWPYDLTEKAQKATFDLIQTPGNIISHHLDNGVPWVEALSDAPLPRNLVQEWQRRMAARRKGQKIFLSITPLDFDRSGLAKYWSNAGEGQPLPKRLTRRCY